MNYSHGDRLDIGDDIKFRDSQNLNQIFAKTFGSKRN